MRETERGSTGITAQVTPSLDLIFDILSNRRRRYALYHLYEQPDGVATLDEITEAVIAFEYRESTADSTAQLYDTPSDDADAEPTLEERRLQVRTELQHTHMPKLEDAGVLEHDQRSKTVRYWSQPSLEEWLEHAQHKEFS